MPSLSSVSLSSGSRSLQSRLTPVLAFGYLLMAAAIIFAALVIFMNSLRIPTISAGFVTPDLVVHKRIFQSYAPGSQILAVDGQTVSYPAQWRRKLQSLQAGDQIELTVRIHSGKQVSEIVQLRQWSLRDKVSFFVIPYTLSLVFLISGAYILAIRRFDPAGRAFSIFASSAAVVLAGIFDLISSHTLTAFWVVALAMIGGGLINLALLFPQSVRQVVRYPFLGWLGYVLALLIGLLSYPAILSFTRAARFNPWQIELLFLGCSIVLLFGIILTRRFRSESPVVREQSRLMLWGVILSLTPLGVWWLVSIINPMLEFSALLLLPLGFFPVLTAYAIIRYRLLNTDFFLGQAVLYALMAGLVMAGYALLVGGASLIFGQSLRLNNPLLIGLMVFILAVGLNPLRNYLQGAVDRFFFKGQVVYRELQQSFSRELTKSMELPEILDVFRRYVDQSIAPLYLHIFIYDPLSGQYPAAARQGGLPTSDIRFPANSALVQVLSRQREALLLTDMGELPESLQSEQARLRLLVANLFVPLPGRNQLIGWLALGVRKSGEGYTGRDLRLLESLSDQVALAVERAQVVVDLERRVRELNVLARVAQGVSFTVTFDDILELLSAQTGQVLPARDFRISLIDEETNILSHVFYLENDERLNEFENRPLPLGQGLEHQVITSQRSIMTDDYERECRRRGLLPSMKNVYAWMGVPLNAGSATIGLMSVASRDPTVVYTEEQRDLLQAIADQASGAIVKSRSLEESERRARQLAKLNEIGVSLTSTLEIKPLLKQILDSATEILNCQAGSLFLIDPQTDELVFEVVIGPVAADLAGKRLPAGAGLVGEAATTGKPIIANDAKRRIEWFNKTDQQTGFDTQDLLVVPLRIQDRVIGVIEVINKENGAPFSLADQDLLTAFTSQATIAIENARLYTMTDQALAARVEELSVMQRIDRELNASLDIERAMQITLGWAMRQSHADAGLVGTVALDGITVMASQGYPQELPNSLLSQDRDRVVLPKNLPGMKDALESGQPQYMLLDGDDTSTAALLDGAKYQTAIPIRRETETIGVMFLEGRSAHADPDELLSYLVRLCGHAAIAIANAQLFEEVKAANLAKSQFVSFVAHELKNPMASIKGYTELVAGGMAGSVNDMQASFLGTVRSNVDRMNTIVSDLNDLTKIQVGNLRLDYQVLQLSDVFDDVVRSLTRQIEEKGQLLAVRLPKDLPAVWADPARLAQIITNLLSNAHKYTSNDGRLILAAECYHPPASELESVEMVQIWVQDSGIGISAEDQVKIFQQYFRTDNAKEMAAGTGLGLAITRSLVEMQGGRIWFESEMGKGATFYFTVPVAETQY